MNIMVVVEFFKNHGVELLQIATSVIGIASIVVKLTPTPKDDVILAKILAFVGKYIALNPNK